MNNTLLKVLACSCVFLSGCNFKTTSDGKVVACSDSVEPAIKVEVIDKETGYRISCGASIVIRDGEFSEERSNPHGTGCDNSKALLGAYEREGTYKVSVFKDGYLDWSTEGIEVSSNVCHVNTITIQAYLEK
ncbi:hypothetical protein INR79_10835 [Vibrio sp. SCSIO 43132]|uniref:hypothetical protein n=1 Tax=Vibrio TaxID=662 RepID=UPI0005FA80C3|nr:MULTISPECIES: hypothetical protein [Vibrio]KJY80868.1 hypothetical protein TW74_00805 [Vibrio nigripulchritudo]UAB69031.1 hypothetical protein INR79_10835 [Vibrio sp. SCSIO 43132]